MAMRRLMVRAAAMLALTVVTIPEASGAEGDPVAGQRVFGRCASCHATVSGKNGIGPSLANVFGRHSGAVEGYNYSVALKDAGLVWDETSLDKFLQNPTGFVRGTKMFLGVANSGDRQNLIAYLKKLPP